MAEQIVNIPDQIDSLKVVMRSLEGLTAVGIDNIDPQVLSEGLGSDIARLEAVAEVLKGIRAAANKA